MPIYNSREFTEEEKQEILKDFETKEEESEEDKALRLRLLENEVVKEELGIVSNMPDEDSELIEKIMFEEAKGDI